MGHVWRCLVHPVPVVGTFAGFRPLQVFRGKDLQANPCRRGYAFSKLIRSILFFLLLAIPACSQPEPAAPIVENLLALMKSGDRQVSLGAMLLSGDVYDSWRLEPYVRGSLSDKDEAWVRAVKAYTLSRYTLSVEDAAAFLDAMLLDQENFNQLIDFECSVMRHPGSGILGYLMDLSRRTNAPELAEKAESVIRKIHPLTDGWVADFLHVE